MANCTPTCSEYDIEVPAPKDAENRKVPLDTKVMYNDKGIECEVSSFNCVFDKYGTEWNVACFTSDSDCIYTRPLDSMYLEKPDSLKQLAEDLNRMQEDYAGNGGFYRDTPCAYAGGHGRSCKNCKLDNGNKCFENMMQDIVDRVNRMAGDSE